MPTSKSQAVYKDKNGAISADKINLVDNSSATPTYVQLQIGPDGKLSFYKDGVTQVIPTVALANTGTPTGGTPTVPSTPPSTLPPTSVVQNGNLLANGDGTSLTVPFASVTTAGTSTATLNGGRYEYNLTSLGYFELGQTFDSPANLVRKLRFSLLVDPTATILNESTIVYIRNKVNGVSKDFLILKLVPEFTQVGTKYNLVIRFAESADISSSAPGLFKKIYKAFDKGTNYDFELYVTDNQISFTQILSGTFPNETQENLTLWYNDPATGRYSDFNLAGRNFDFVHFGEWYTNGSANFSGKYSLDNLQLYQSYIVPTVPNDQGKIAEVWKGWKTRYLKPNGMVVKDDGGLFDDGIQRPNCVSEAQAYGMLIAAQLGDKTTFDSIHNFNQTVLRRSVCKPSDPVAPSHLAYLYDPYKAIVIDSSGAPDADIDCALALIWAHEKWGSAGAINYSAKALEVINDMKTYSFINYKGKKIIDGGTWNYPNGQSREINPSYQSPGACKKFKDFTGDTFWDQARDGAYLIWKDSGDATLKGKTGAGVIPNWVHVDGSNDAITNPLGSDYSIDHSYDAFRAEHRGYWDHLWNPATSGFASFAAYRLKGIYEAEWNSTGRIAAERSHDNITGSNIYEAPIFTSKSWMTLVASNSSIAPAVKTAKLLPANQYKFHPTGSYYSVIGYFGESWQLIFQMQEAGFWRYVNS